VTKRAPCPASSLLPLRLNSPYPLDRNRNARTLPSRLRHPVDPRQTPLALLASFRSSIDEQAGIAWSTRCLFPSDPLRGKAGWCTGCSQHAFYSMDLLPHSPCPLYGVIAGLFRGPRIIQEFFSPPFSPVVPLPITFACRLEVTVRFGLASSTYPLFLPPVTPRDSRSLNRMPPPSFLLTSTEPRPLRFHP